MAAPGTPDPGAASPGAGGGQPQPQPTPGGPEAGGGGGAPSQAPASPESMALAKLYQACKALAQQNPVLSPGLSKAAEGINEAQTALVTQPKNEAPQQSPPY
jgi:hypothetical protein